MVNLFPKAVKKDLTRAEECQEIRDLVRALWPLYTCFFIGRTNIIMPLLLPTSKDYSEDKI